MADSPVIFNDTFEQIMNGVTLGVFDLLHTGVAIVDTLGYIGYCNKAFLKMYGLPPNAIGRHIGDYFLVEKNSLAEELQSKKMIVSIGHSTNNVFGILFRYPIYDSKQNFCGIAIESIPAGVGRAKLNSLLENMRTLEMRTLAPGAGKPAQSPAICTFEGMIGQSPQMANLRFLGQRFALSDEPVLISGESGTGKELVAKALHQASPRASAPFVSVNCAALPADLLVSELFGYEAGTFTGGRSGGMKGKFEEANNGTIFLDEIGELPLEAQAKLLRVLESGEIQKLGHKGTLHSNFRLLGATNRDLLQMVRQRQFREDLYHRLSVFELNVPPLRERGDDLLLLVRYYLELYLEADTIVKLDPEMEKIFKLYTWPGNIRELKNTLVYALYSLGNEQTELGREHMPPRFLKSMKSQQAARKPEETRREDAQVVPELDRQTPSTPKQPGLSLLQSTLARLRYNKVLTARELGISRSTLYRMMHKYGLQM